ncbi:MAG: CRTAC1 family protein [Acidobacteriaceae bacterium]|nr:CRTAC1 family protein [Acidobacteriaceae bacterium]
MRRRDFWGAMAAGLLGCKRLSADISSIFAEIPPERSGIRWIHENGRSEDRFLPETTGAGCAFLDYDGDGWMDLYFVNSGPADFFQPRRPLRNALYKNNRDGTFTDVTEQAGVAGGFFGMGAAVGDFDNDGFPDLFVSGVGKCTLYCNRGDGTFSDVTAAAGLAHLTDWTTSAVWFDYDNDGKLDLFVCSYIDFSPPVRRACGANPIGRHYYCSPRGFPPTCNHLFHNNGDGTFREVGQESIIGRLGGKSLGVVASDINNDGRMDLFVSNDTVRNFLFVNRGPDQTGRTKWEEIGVAAEVAYSADGQARSGMGVDAADFNNDGWQDLFVSNIDKEVFALYRNDHRERFEDVSAPGAISKVTRQLSGWAVKFFDFDNDGELDLLLANGHPNDMISLYSPEVQYKEPLLLLKGKGGQFYDISAGAGHAFEGSYAARGLAVGDFDNDGRLDAIIAVNGDRPLLLHNENQSGNHWLGLTLVGTTCNRDAIGAQVRWSAGGKIRSRAKNGGGSYLSSHDPRLILGLGAAQRLDWLEIIWPRPSTCVQRFESLPLDRYIAIVEKAGAK